MVIQFTKARHADRPPTMTCTREDGTTTGMPSTDFFIRHDLTHLAVESVLGIDDAFYGLLGSGWDINTFEERQPGSRKVRTMPPNALQVELIVGTFDLQRATGKMSPRQLLEILHAKPNFVLSLNELQVEEIDRRTDELMDEWQQLAPGETMRLTFSKTGPDADRNNMPK